MVDTGKSLVDSLRHAGHVGLAEGEKVAANLAREPGSNTSTQYKT